MKIINLERTKKERKKAFNLDQTAINFTITNLIKEFEKDFFRILQILKKNKLSI